MSTYKARTDFISNVRTQATNLVEALDALKALRRQWDNEINTSLIDATGSDPAAEGYNAHDFLEHAGLMKADVSAVFTSADSFETLMAQGHGTNLQKVRI